MALVSGKFFQESDKDPVPAIFLKDLDPANGVAHVYVFDVEHGPRPVVARIFASKDDIQPGDKDIFIVDAD